MEDTIMEVREDFMLSPAGDSKPILRTAHFLKPIQNTINEPPSKFNPFSSSASSVFEPKEWPLKIHFNGWRRPRERWVSWVDQLKLKYESLWKKVGIFEAIMSTKCCILRNENLLFGVVEKWCCKTNTFVFPFGEATITLEDVMVLGGYPIFGDPVFISLEDQELREVEKKLILARQQLYTKQGGEARTSLWMNIFIDKGSEIEHEAFLATWLSIFVFPHRSLVKSSLFPIAIHLARGNPIALGPAVLASIYRDLTLFKKTIVELSRLSVGTSDRYPLEVTLPSPFYLVQIWVWERFKNLQPQPQTKLTNHGDPLLFRWHKVQTLKIDDVKLALDSAFDDFLWRPYVRFADKCKMFYPNDEIWVPFEKDLDKEMLSLVTCLRVSELVGFESIEQYLPHRVAMQFGMDQDVPSYVPRYNETKFIAWKNYCRPISDEKLYFPPRLFEADVTTRYAKWWKHLVLGHDDFVKKTVRRERSTSSRKHRLNVENFNTSGNDVGVPPGFPPNLVDTLKFGKFGVEGLKFKTRKIDDFNADVPAENSVLNCLKADENIDADVPAENSVLTCLKANENIDADVPAENSVLNCLKADTNIDADVEVYKLVLEEYNCGDKVHQSKNLLNRCCSTSSADNEKILPLKRPVSKGVLEDGLKDANESKKARMFSGRVCLSETQGKGQNNAIRNEVSLSNHEFGEKGKSVRPFTSDMITDLENRIKKLERVFAMLKEARFGKKLDIV